jgi:murein DD-endopeptidase MepM/ murein hydrolase activator NlpD
MTSRSRAVTVIVQRDGAIKAATYRIPLWAFRTATFGGLAVALLIVLGIGFSAPLARQAARVPRLEAEVRRLATDNARIRELAGALDSVEANYARLRRMVGADIVPDPVALATTLAVAPPVWVVPPGRRPRFEPGPSIPRHWPLDEPGYVTRGQVKPDSTEEAHPGIDIALPIGTVVRAAGGGTVIQSGVDPEYGLFVLLAHPEGYQTRYGHLSRALATEGAAVRAGETLGRSGNTGRSTAPHLHFEVRQNGVSVDPSALIRENR